MKNKKTRHISQVYSNQRRLTTEEFIRRAKIIHKNKYKYGSVVYVNSKTKVKIFCNTHNEFFMMTPDTHLYKRSDCPKCSNELRGKNKTRSNSDFIKSMKEKYGDQFTYENTNYTGNKNPIIITCKIHGDFERTPVNLLSGRGCKKCIKENERKKLEDKFIRRAKEINGDKNDYSQVHYVGDKTNVKIICNIHGQFFQTPSKHIYRRDDCPKCGIIKNGNSQRKTTEQFIKESKAIFKDENGDDLLGYDKCIYTGSKNDVELYCKKHKEYFKIVPMAHTGKHKQSCPKCSLESQGKIEVYDTNSFIERAQKVHVDENGEPLYTYKDAIYTYSKNKLKITCRLHGNFLQSPDSHVTGKHKCPICSSSEPEKRIFMYLKKLNIDFIKEYKIKGYRYNYDFFLKDLNLLIEYDGRQHFKPVKYMYKVPIKNPEEALKERQKIDRLKDKIAEDNNYIIERIPYTLEKHLEQTVLLVISKHYPYKKDNKFYSSLKDFLISQNLPENTSYNDVKHNLTYNHYDYENDIP